MYELAVVPAFLYGIATPSITSTVDVSHARLTVGVVASFMASAAEVANGNTLTANGSIMQKIITQDKIRLHIKFLCCFILSSRFIRIFFSLQRYRLISGRYSFFFGDFGLFFKFNRFFGDFGLFFKFNLFF